jgi:hypothetical protein
LVAIAELALELQEIPPLISLVLARFKHVVTLCAKSNALKLLLGLILESLRCHL